MLLIFLLYSVLFTYFTSVNSQTLKFKDVKTCPAKIQSKLRAQSLLLVRKISSKDENVQTLPDCFTKCSTKPSCSFAYQEAKKSCLVFTGVLANETISRFLSEGWQYGKVNSKNKVRLSSFCWVTRL